MSVRPYLLVGESDQRFLAQRVGAAIGAWGSDWLADGAPEPALQRVEMRAEPRAERWLAARADAPQLLLGCRSGWLAQIGALLAGPSPNAAERAPALASQVGEVLLEALARRLFGSLQAAAMPQMRWEGAGAPQSWLEPGAGSAIYDLSPLLPVIVVLSPALVAASLPRAKGQRAAREPLAPLPGAMEACPVGLQAVVGEAELELGELARLAAGDVIVLDRRLDEPLGLRLGGEAVARIHLGIAAGAKAVQVVARARN